MERDGYYTINCFKILPKKEKNKLFKLERPFFLKKKKKRKRKKNGETLALT